MWRLVCALLLCAVTSSAATVERLHLKGAYALVTIPDDWNGSLFLYAHGYTADERILQPIPEQFGDADPVLWPGLLDFVPAGYATAVSTFRSTGWDVKDAIKDVETLRRAFVKRHGRPKHTYLWGHSEGGMITQTVIELFPDAYDGAAPMCGTGAGARRTFDGFYDLRVLYDYVCRDVPTARFACGLCPDATTRCLEDADCPGHQPCGANEAAPAPEDGLTRQCFELLMAHPERFGGALDADAFITRAVTPCLGGDMPTPEQAARRDLLARASQLSAAQLPTNLFFASLGLAEVVYRRTHGGHPWGNLGVHYGAPALTANEAAALDAGVHRSDSDADAVRFVRRFYEPRGRTRAKVVTVHALDDELVIPEHETKYRQAFEASARTAQLVQFFTPHGQHCLNYYAFTPALQQLVAWVEHGIAPTPTAMNAACGDCLATTLPGPYGAKVPERTQRGAPLASMICAGAVGDCPPETHCATARHRCER